MIYSKLWKIIENCCFWCRLACVGGKIYILMWKLGFVVIPIKFFTNYLDFKVQNKAKYFLIVLKIFSFKKNLVRNILMLFSTKISIWTMNYVTYPNYLMDFFGHHFWILRPKISHWIKFPPNSRIKGVSLKSSIQIRGQLFGMHQSINYIA